MDEDVAEGGVSCSAAAPSCPSSVFGPRASVGVLCALPGVARSDGLLAGRDAVCGSVTDVCIRAGGGRVWHGVANWGVLSASVCVQLSASVCVLWHCVA
jgi:hypothetical protein